MNVSKLSKVFFEFLEHQLGPFDRPIQFRPFPFDMGGSLNFLTIGRGEERFVTYVSWDLFGHPEHKRGSVGRHELLASCENEDWCLNILTNIGRQGLDEIFEPGDTLDITAWTKPGDSIQGVVFEEALKTELKVGSEMEKCGLLRCIGVTHPELEFARNYGVPELCKVLKENGIYPHTVTKRESVIPPP